MFDCIHNDPDLFALIRNDCRENDIGATISNDLLDEGGHLLHERVIVLKLDAFYSSLRMHDPPPSPDYLVIVQCSDGTYEAYIIELRKTDRTAYVRSSVIVKKFQTALNDFLSLRYRHIFFPDGDIAFKNIRLYLVTDPLGLQGRHLSQDEYRKSIKGTVLDAYGSLPPLRVGNHICLIEPVLPDPTVQAC